MGLTLITPPTDYPVTLAEAKAHLRVEDEADDSLIDGLIAAAAEHIEQYTGKALMAQTWKLTLDAFTDAIQLHRGPVQAVTQVQYFDEAGVSQTVSATDFTLDKTNDPAWVVINSDAAWPATLSGVNMVSVTYEAGYSTLPASIKHATLLLLGQWYDNRADVTDKPMISMPNAVEALLRSFRNLLV